MSKHFCCCIPVRFGVFILSLLTLLGSAGTAFGVWWLLANGPDRGITFDGGMKIGFIVAGVVYTIFALISLFGFIGAIIRNRALVKTYSVFLWVQLVISLALGIALAIALFNDSIRNKLIDACTTNLVELQDNAVAAGPNITINKQTKQDIANSCSAVFNQSRVGFIISYCISFLINLYCCIIVHRYGTQLTEEQSYKGDSHAMGQTYAAKDAPQGYYPHTPLSTVEGGQSYAYPYAQKEHGFGATNH